MTQDLLPRLMDDATLAAARSLIDNHTRFIVTTHMSPDGDAVGSATAMARYLRRKGKEVTVVYNDLPGENLHFIPGYHDGLAYDNQQVGGRPDQRQAVADAVAAAEVLVATDYNTLSRIGDLSALLQASRAPRLLLDHHLSPDTEAFDVVVSRPELCAACEVVGRFIIEMGDDALLDRTTATALYCGLMTDTGGFMYNCNSPSLYALLARLMQEGVPAENLRRQNALELERRVRLRGYAMSQKLHIEKAHRAAWFSLDKTELKRYNHQKGDSEGFVNVPLDIVGVVVSAFFREEKNFVKVSLRSKGRYPVNEICERFFNGGGHQNAAGGEFHGSLQQAEQLFVKVLPLFDKYLE